MSIKLDKNKQKKITMELNVEGIESDKLNFTFRINGENCELGFPGKLVEENKLQIEIPPLKSAGYIKKGTYTASLEVDDNDRYFMKPWQGEVQVESSPQVTSVYEEELGKTKQNSSINVQNISESSEEPKEPTKKWTKEDAKKFINEARKRLNHKDPQKVDKYITQELEKRGFKYTPKKKKSQTKNISESKPTKTIEKANSKQDIITYLNSKGMKKDSSVNAIMEKVENDTGGDIEKMLDLVKDMMESSNNQQSTIQENQMQSISKYYENKEPNESDKEALMSKIQQAKADMHSQFNS